MFVRNQMASWYWEINLSGSVWEEAGEMVSFFLCARKRYCRGVPGTVYKSVCFLQKATVVEDFANEKQSDSVKIGFTKPFVYNVAICLSSLFQTFLLYKHYKL